MRASMPLSGLPAWRRSARILSARWLCLVCIHVRTFTPRWPCLVAPLQLPCQLPCRPPRPAARTPQLLLGYVAGRHESEARSHRQERNEEELAAAAWRSEVECSLRGSKRVAAHLVYSCVQAPDKVDLVVEHRGHCLRVRTRRVPHVAQPRRCRLPHPRIVGRQPPGQLGRGWAGWCERIPR